MQAYSNTAGWLPPSQLRELSQSRARRKSSEDARRIVPHRIESRLSPDKIAEIVRLYDSGVPTREIATSFGIRQRAVQSILTKRGRQLMQMVDVSPAQEEHAIRLYVDERLSIARVASRLDLPLSAVRRVLRNRGVTMRHRHDRIVGLGG